MTTTNKPTLDATTLARNEALSEARRMWGGTGRGTPQAIHKTAACTFTVGWLEFRDGRWSMTHSGTGASWAEAFANACQRAEHTTTKQED